MIRHIVMFKLKNDGDKPSIERNKQELKRRLEALPAKIDVIRSMEVGINVVESVRAFDLALISGFDSLDDLEAYRIHPAHQEVIGFVAGIKDQTASVDFIL